MRNEPASQKRGFHQWYRRVDDAIKKHRPSPTRGEAEILSAMWGEAYSPWLKWTMREWEKSLKRA